MKKRLWYMILPVMTLILEILPYGAVCNFAHPAEDGSIEHARKLYSYFDLVPYGYANIGPFFTAIVTCIVLVFLVIHVFTGKKRLLVVVRRILCVGVLFSLGPLMFGVNYLSIIGVLITVFLVTEWMLLRFYGGRTE